MKILIVEDEGIKGRMLRRLIQLLRPDAEITVEGCVAKGALAFLNNQPDLLITDWDLPLARSEARRYRAGGEAMVTMAQSRKVPVVVISGRDPEKLDGSVPWIRVDRATAELKSYLADFA